jgi:PAS domain S-box-containing protein
MDIVQLFLNKTPNILIVENSSSDLTAFTIVLTQKGYIVKNTKNNDMLLQSAKEFLPDLILLDITTIDTTGYEVCQTIKADDALREIPVIFVNSDSHTIDIEKVFAVGGADYFTSPFTYSEVFARIETHLKFNFFHLENRSYKNNLKHCKQTVKELLEENFSLKESLLERTKQIEEITTDLKEFNILLEDEITGRTKTEEALKESERQFRHAIEESPVPMILYAEDGEIIKISRALTDITGYTITDIPTLLHFVEISKVLVDDLKCPDKHRMFNLEVRQNGGENAIKTSLGDIRVWDFYSSHIGKLQDNRNLFSIVAIDITERKRMDELQKSVEEERKRLDEIKEYDKIKTEFFSNISHELRTPINVIFSALQVLELKLKDCTCQKSSNDRYRYTKIMKQNCYRLLRLINNLIDITKIDSGYYDINKSNIDIISVIENITLSVADYIENKGLSLIFDTAIEEKIIACDAEKLERIILNLLSNAVKFTPFGGKIMVNIEDCNENICIIIKDTGRGIPEDKLNSIFERFVQVDKSLARDHEGSGIGLSLVKCLVELHGGTISVKSEEGYGTEFNISIPCKLIDEVQDEVAATDSLGESYIGKISIEFSDIYN